MCTKSKILLSILVILLGCALAMKTYSNKHPLTDTSETREKKMPLITRPSGLAFEIIQHGNGQSTPKPGQQVSVHYTGWLDDGNGNPGKKFDSSLDRKTPFTFVIGTGQVIKGWDEGVLEMKVGEKRRLIIPANLGYGSRGCAGVIPGNATLIFDVELLEIK
jgi:FKBP-type peptidyl-prolyl cis-trans isomerase